MRQRMMMSGAVLPRARYDTQAILWFLRLPLVTASRSRTVGGWRQEFETVRCWRCRYCSAFHTHAHTRARDRGAIAERLCALRRPPCNGLDMQVLRGLHRICCEECSMPQKTR